MTRLLTFTVFGLVAGICQANIFEAIQKHAAKMVQVLPEVNISGNFFGIGTQIETSSDGAKVVWEPSDTFIEKATKVAEAADEGLDKVADGVKNAITQVAGVGEFLKGAAETFGLVKGNDDTASDNSNVETVNKDIPNDAGNEDNTTGDTPDVINDQTESTDGSKNKNANEEVESDDGIEENTADDAKDDVINDQTESTYGTEVGNTNKDVSSDEGIEVVIFQDIDDDVEEISEGNEENDGTVET